MVETDCISPESRIYRPWEVLQFRTFENTGTCLIGPLVKQGESDPYFSLATVLCEAYDQAKYGKGKERHADDDNFEDQLIVTIQDHVGGGFAAGQAIKKIVESKRLATDPAVKEILGAINYLAAYIIWLRKQPRAEVQFSGQHGITG